jgi:hypothetical protein
LTSTSAWLRSGCGSGTSASSACGEVVQETSARMRRRVGARRPPASAPRPIHRSRMTLWGTRSDAFAQIRARASASPRPGSRGTRRAPPACALMSNGARTSPLLSRGRRGRQASCGTSALPRTDSSAPAIPDDCIRVNPLVGPMATGPGQREVPATRPRDRFHRRLERGLTSASATFRSPRPKPQSAERGLGAGTPTGLCVGSWAVLHASSPPCFRRDGPCRTSHGSGRLRRMRWRLGTPPPPSCAPRSGTPRSPSSSQIVWAIAPLGIKPTDQQLLDGFGRR